MREPIERTTVVHADRGRSAGLIAGVIIAILAVVAVIFLFNGNFGGADIDATPTAGIEAPDVKVDVPNADVDVNVTKPDAPAAGD